MHLEESDIFIVFFGDSCFFIIFVVTFINFLLKVDMGSARINISIKHL